MADVIQYGDPGVEPRPGRGIMYWLGQQYRKGIKPGGDTGIVDPGLFSGNTVPTNVPVGMGGGELTGLVSPEQLARFRAGAGLAGAMAYDPTQEMGYMGLGTTPPDYGLSPEAIRFQAQQQFAPGAVGYAGQQYPAAAYAARHGTGVGYQPPGVAASAGGQKERIDYEYIRDMEQWLKEAGYTGTTVDLPNFDEQGNYKSSDIIRRDNQGRVLRITRGVTDRRPSRIGYLTSGKPRRASFLETKEQTRWKERKKEQKQTPAPSTGSNYPNWVINMSNWRGI